MKDYDKSKESSYLKYWDVNNLYGCTLSEKLLVDGFTSHCNNHFIENYSENSNKR